ncbi:MAG: large subunit ribosomal protein L13 [Planctomycetota bacterium]|jgi:large subunit ribosomal protein L13
MSNYMKYTIDATNQKLGRIATEAAMVLRGKNLPDFAPNKMPGTIVEIINASKIDFSSMRLDKVYTRYTGYPGGLRGETRGHLIDRRGYLPVFEHAVRGMLPNNKLRSRILKNLIIVD